MNWQLLIPLLITTVVAVLGWLVGHALNAKRDLQNKRREIRVKYLVEAYRRLENASCRGPIHEMEVGKEFESAIADIQLFGTEEQTQMVREMAVAISSSQKDVSATPLLISLRNSLRDELDLGVLNEEPFQFRLSVAESKPIQRAPFDYTKCRKTLWAEQSIEEISRMAMENYGNTVEPPLQPDRKDPGGPT